MQKIPRGIFKIDSVYKKLYETIKEGHVVAEHTKKVLLENKHIKDFCEEATHFIVLPGTPSLFIDYEIHSWYRKPREIVVSIVSITIYDDFMEYEKARLTGLHSAEDADIPGTN